ncbi:MAG TPA: tripartite tricarboxylate transporter substrate binding protein [Syntrophorhabdales bacterium]|nr:tripartite tricarboxylate transporter substrate binding protein [Syntrophorhabdales bacterium]
MNAKRIASLKQTGVSLLVCVAMLLVATQAKSEFPEKPITIMVSFDAGSTTDILARAAGIGAEKYLNSRFVYENKGGGGGTVALGVLSAARPDGYTIWAGNSDSFVYTPMMQKVPFKPLKSFTQILGFAAAPYTALIVKPDAPWRNFQEFVDYAKKNPRKIKYSSSGVGTGMHLAMEYIAARDGIQWVHVPYKSAAAARMALMGGHVDACSAGAEFVPFGKQGMVRVLATHGDKRSPAFPDVPTLKELGYDFVKDTIFSLAGPAPLPPDVLKKLETGFTRGTETAEFISVREKLDCLPAHYNAAAYDRYLKDLWVRTEKMFKDAAIIKEPATEPY